MLRGSIPVSVVGHHSHDDGKAGKQVCRRDTELQGDPVYRFSAGRAGEKKDALNNTLPAS